MAEVTTGKGADELSEISWFHSIELGHGVVTPGTPPNVALERPGAFPDVRGRSVLDIGAWDGKYSFRAEQGLHQLCLAAGFRRVLTRVGPPPLVRQVRSRWRDHRLFGSTEWYRAVVHAYP